MTKFIYSFLVFKLFINLIVVILNSEGETKQHFDDLVTLGILQKLCTIYYFTLHIHKFSFVPH